MEAITSFMVYFSEFLTASLGLVYRLVETLICKKIHAATVDMDSLK